ncbi:NINE protein [Alloscardovia theropitheci]|uniref:NINE protein n=1 Tax=Alloscardovia theropitheci TaxID=2496842 RepID=A0A4R0QQU0_9BIFI|nr:TM2 domain-containing protein [Alloscardovia theropitheci]TCD53698.1 NINE protein [Alloscardovia theropitheci]
MTDQVPYEQFGDDNPVPQSQPYTPQPSEPATPAEFSQPSEQAAGDNQPSQSYGQPVESDYNNAPSQLQFAQPQYNQVPNAQPQFGQSPYVQQPQQPQYAQPQPQYAQPQYTQPQYGQQVPPVMPQAVPQANGWAPNGAPLMVGTKSKVLAAVLAFFLGGIGIHNFYLGKTTRGIIQLVMGTVGWILIVPPLISAVWGFVEFILILVAAPGTPYHQDGMGYELQD